MNELPESAAPEAAASQQLSQQFLTPLRGALMIEVFGATAVPDRTVVVALCEIPLI
jgi:hypothetical protein